MTDCKHIKELLLEYIDNEISEDKRMLVDDHLSGCSACTMELEALAATESKLRQAYQEVAAGVSPSAGVWESIRREVAGRQQARRPGESSLGSRLKGLFNWRRPLWRLGAAGAAALSYALVLFMNGAPTPVPLWTVAEQSAIDIARGDPSIQALLEGEGVVYEVIPVNGDDEKEYYQVAIIQGAGAINLEGGFAKQRSNLAPEHDTYSFDDGDALSGGAFEPSGVMTQATLVVDVKGASVLALEESSAGDYLSTHDVVSAARIANSDPRIGAGALVKNVSLLNGYDAAQNSLTDEMVVWVRLTLGGEVYFAQVDLNEGRVVKLINGGEE
jgi:hypothetical protein